MLSTQHLQAYHTVPQAARPKIMPTFTLMKINQEDQKKLQKI